MEQFKASPPVYASPIPGLFSYSGLYTYDRKLSIFLKSMSLVDSNKDQYNDRKQLLRINASKQEDAKKKADKMELNISNYWKDIEENRCSVFYIEKRIEDSERKLKDLELDEANKKLEATSLLSDFQEEIIQRNHCKLMIKTRQLDIKSKEVECFKEKDPAVLKKLKLSIKTDEDAVYELKNSHLEDSTLLYNEARNKLKEVEKYLKEFLKQSFLERSSIQMEISDYVEMISSAKKEIAVTKQLLESDSKLLEKTRRYLNALDKEGKELRQALVVAEAMKRVEEIENGY